ncbi:MAG: hypothetical protein ACK5HY_13175, partial [Parahaliea sp.]
MIGRLRDKLAQRALRVARRRASVARCATLRDWAHNTGVCGVGNTEPREIVVTLSSYDRRVEYMYICVESLLRQSLRPDRIILWLSRHNFPDETLPENLLRLRARGLEIAFRD